MLVASAARCVMTMTMAAANHLTQPTAVLQQIVSCCMRRARWRQRQRRLSYCGILMPGESWTAGSFCWERQEGSEKDVAPRQALVQQSLLMQIAGALLHAHKVVVCI